MRNIKIVKYIICVFLFFAIAVFNGEFFVLNFSASLGTLFNGISIDLRDAENYENAETLLAEKADEDSVFLYYIDEYKGNSLEKVINIYSNSEKAEMFLLNASSLKKKDYKALIMNDVKLNFYSLDELDMKQELYVFRCTGEEKNRKAFMQSVAENFENLDFESERYNRINYTEMEYFYILIGFWIVTAVISFIFSCFDVVMKKKEVMVLYSLGAKRSEVLLKNIFYDLIALIVIFAVSFLGLSFLTETLALVTVSIAMMLLVWFVGCLPYFSLLKIDLKKAFSSLSVSSSTLGSCYVLKIFTSVMTVCIFATGFTSLSQYLQESEKIKSVEKYRDYSHVTIAYKNSKLSDDEQFDKETRIKYKIYRDLFEDGKAVVQTSFYDLGTYANKKLTGMFLNRNAKGTILDEFEEITEEMINEEKAYIIIPSAILNEEEEKEIVSIMEGYVSSDSDVVLACECESEVISYTKEASVMNIRHGTEVYDPEGEIVKNPVILFYNLPENKMKNELFESSETLTYSRFLLEGIFDITKEELDEYLINNTDIDVDYDFCYIDNVYDVYENYYSIIKQSLIITFMLLLLFLILETIVIWSVVKLQYSVFATELAVKTALGYSIFEKNRKIFIITAVVMLLGLIAMVAVNSMLQLYSLVIVFIGYFILTGIEILIIVFFVKKIEKSQIQKILKGGSL